VLLAYPAESGAARTVAASADAYVTAAAPKRNYGGAAILRTGKKPVVRSYVRLRVSGVTGPFRKVTLLLHSLRTTGTGSFLVRPVASRTWRERAINHANAPTPSAGSRSGRARAGGNWIAVDVTPWVRRNGTFTFALLARAGTAVFASREAPANAPRLVVETGDTRPPTIAAAGNIACDPDPLQNVYDTRDTPPECRHQATSDLLMGGDLTTVLTLGDAQYGCGGLGAYQSVFGPSWGRVKGITRPAISNHDYRTSGGTGCDATGGASGYFDYFGAAAGPRGSGYYSFDVGGWHLIALNSACDRVGGCEAGSSQERWLRADLARNRAACTLAYWHHPRFSSSYQRNRPVEVGALYRALYEARADVLLTAHDHIYERFAPQDPDGRADARGVRQFVVGTGGYNHHHFLPLAPPPNSEVRNNETFGVLRLVLGLTGYSWRFTPEAGKSFTDSGSTSCR